MNSNKDDLTPETEDAPAPKHHPKLASVTMSIGVVVALTTVIVCSYLLFSLFKGSLDQETIEALAPKTGVEETAEPENGIAETNTPPPIIETEQKPQAEVQALPPLPDLNNSDEKVREAAMSLNNTEGWSDWVTTDEAIRKLVVVVDNLAAGKIARKHLPVPKPKAVFRSTEDGINYYLDPTGFERYTPYVRLFKNIDTAMTARLYQRYSPLLEEAFAELGYADRSFHDTLLQAFDVLLQAPVINGKVELVRPSVYYKFLDPALEKSPDVHKQLIRMGPQNTQDIQLKIQELKTALSGANEQHQG